jgi:hypothetical protein
LVGSGILLYEMLYGYTPFRGKTRQRTFANILHKDIRFPACIPVNILNILWYGINYFPVVGKNEDACRLAWRVGS